MKLKKHELNEGGKQVNVKKLISQKYNVEQWNRIKY